MKISLKKFSKKEKILLAVTVSLALFALTYTFVVEPLVSNWHDNQKRIEVKARLLIEDLSLFTRYPTMKEEYRKLVQIAKASGKREEEISAVLADIESLARSASLDITSLKPLSAKKTGDYTEIILEITATADTQQLSKFLYEVETGERFLKVKRMTLAGAPGSEGGLRCNLNISKVFID